MLLNRSIVSVSTEGLRERGIPPSEWWQYLPDYLTMPRAVSCGPIRRLWFGLCHFLLSLLVWVFLRPRVSKVGQLDQGEVNDVYNLEAATYDRKHHLTTRGQDLFFRRAAAWFVTTFLRRHADQEPIKVLDLCTGTGLTVEAIVEIARQWKCSMEVVGLDFCRAMLDRAQKRFSMLSRDTGVAVRAAWGDATNLVDDRQPTEEGMTQFNEASFDAITQMCGVGGIPNPRDQFDGVLRILKPGGSFFMSDIHHPIVDFPGEWPFLLKWLRFPTFEVYAYERITLPLVLQRLWGWHDPTAAFYELPLVTYHDGDKWWGFEVDFFEVESQRWWFALPIMPTGKIIVRKVEIDEETAHKRQVILESARFIY